MTDHPVRPSDPGIRRQIILPDPGAWISGPMLDIDEAVMAAALAVPCPIHQVEAGDPCPLVGACLARQSLAPDLS